MSSRDSRTSEADVVVPGSIGNVGPGFDTLGLAIALYLRVNVAEVVDNGRGELACRFLDTRPIGANGIRRAFHEMERLYPGEASIEVEVRSEIPQRAGLGSSAAATIAGIRLHALANRRRIGSAEVLKHAARIEGHPDNVAAIVCGGLTSSCVREDGTVSAARWPWPPSWRVIVATPETRLPTEMSRRVLPGTVPFDDARFNLQRMALLLQAAREGRADAFSEALSDRLHQPYRELLVPGLRAALELKHPDLLGACLSGSGPSVAFFVRRRILDVRRAVERLYQRQRIRCAIRVLKVHQ